MTIAKLTVCGALFTALAGGPIEAQAPTSAFVNFEGAQTNPIRISADGTRLFAVNTPNGTLSVFDLSQPYKPALIAEIPVGIEPVSVNINPYGTGNDEAWVTNQISNSVSVVSVSKGIVTDTVYAKAEPADVVFAGGNLAFVSISRNHLVNVYNAKTHAFMKSISLTGEQPRALAVSPDGKTVYVAFAISGNHTTIVPAVVAPTPPPPTNPNLPPPPQVGLIVDADNPAYNGIIKYTVPDYDVAAITVSTLAVSKYYPHLGTINLGLAVNPQSGDLYVANMDALNLVMFEPNLKGHIFNHQITSVNPNTSQTQVWNLNPNIDYGQLPNPGAVAKALSMPTALAFDPGGRYLYFAAFGTDRVGIFDTATGTVTRFMEINPQALGATVNPATKRGPRGLALKAASNVLYVLNRLYNSISVMNLNTHTLNAEIPAGSVNPTPLAIRNGRGFLYDHKLSGNGTAACVDCHVDADMDLLAWNLGDPGGSMSYLYENNQKFAFHPMKGPMTTQTLRGLANVEPYHWRGDKANLAAFNGAFASLLGGAQLSNANMAAFTNFVNTIVFPPNPNLNLDGSFPDQIALVDYPRVKASPSEGRNNFQNVAFDDSGNTCNTCHTSNPGPGTNLNVRIPEGTGPSSEQPFKIPHLRNMYQKINTDFTAGNLSVNGFGLNHDGAIDGLFSQAGQNTFGTFADNIPVKQTLEAFELCFDTGTVPAVGYTRTLMAATVTTTPAQTDWTTLQSQAAAGRIDLIVNGTIQGHVHGLLYQPSSGNYQTDTSGIGPYTQAQLTAFIQGGDTLTIMGVPPGSGVRMALDWNLDGIKNGDAAGR